MSSSMSGQEWYNRFKAETDKGLFPGEFYDDYKIGIVLDAAKRAAGIIDVQI